MRGVEGTEGLDLEGLRHRVDLLRSVSIVIYNEGNHVKAKNEAMMGWKCPGTVREGVGGVKWRTHVGVVQGVGQIDLVALACSLVSLVLGDDNRAVKVVLLGDDSQGLDKDGGVLFAGKIKHCTILHHV